MEPQPQPPPAPAPKVPVTILTGQLGSGKSTVLSRALSRTTKKVAVIMNEFAQSADVEGKTLRVAKDGLEVEEWLELDNGCMCCSSQDAGVRSIERLMEKKGRFDYVIIELSGVADPSAVAPLFWLDEGLGSDLYLDAVVCVVDCLNIERQLAEGAGGADETARQIACCDAALLSKTDLAPDQRPRAEAIVRSINPAAPVHASSQGSVPLEHILDLDAYGAGTRAFAEVHQPHSPSPSPLPIGAPRVHAGISAVSIPIPALSAYDIQHGALDRALRTLLWEGELPPLEGPGRQQILRCKGLLYASEAAGDDPERVFVVQAVREVYHVQEITDPDPPERGRAASRLVVIGRHLNEGLADRFLAFMRQPPA